MDFKQFGQLDKMALNFFEQFVRSNQQIEVALGDYLQGQLQT